MVYVITAMIAVWVFVALAVAGRRTLPGRVRRRGRQPRHEHSAEVARRAVAAFEATQRAQAARRGGEDEARDESAA
jgi:type II secretory pathway component PulJ